MRASSQFLRTDKLQSGDVLLVRSSGKPSKLISKATNGPYSHAAIFYQQHLPYIFEAQGDGVGFSRLPFTKVEVHSGHRRFFCDVSAYQRIDVFRLPSDARPHGYGSDAFRHRFLSVLDRYNGHDYSNLARLAQASWIGRSSPRFSSSLMWAIGQLAAGDGAKELPGPFCSELVVEVLTQSGFALLRGEHKANSLAPSDLADKNVTQLVRVEDCFDTITTTIANDQDWFSMVNNISFVDKKVVGGITKLGNRSDALIARLLDDLPNIDKPAQTRESLAKTLIAKLKRTRKG